MVSRELRPVDTVVHRNVSSSMEDGFLFSMLHAPVNEPWSVSNDQLDQNYLIMGPGKAYVAYHMEPFETDTDVVCTKMLISVRARNEADSGIATMRLAVLTIGQSQISQGFLFRGGQEEFSTLSGLFTGAWTVRSLRKVEIAVSVEQGLEGILHMSNLGISKVWGTLVGSLADTPPKRKTRRQNRTRNRRR